MSTFTTAATWAVDHTLLLIAVTAAYGALAGVFARIVTARLNRKVRAWNTRAGTLQAQQFQQARQAPPVDHAVPPRPALERQR